MTYSDIVPFTHTKRAHRLMINPHSDYENKVNPPGYTFPSSGFDNISYYRECGDVHLMDPVVGSIDFLDTILFLDFKITDLAIQNSNVMDFILAYMNNSQPLKIFHFVNFWKPLIPSYSWDIFCDTINTSIIKEGVFLELHNKYPNEHIDDCLDEIFKLNFDKFIGIEYHHLDKKHKFVPIKNPKNENIGKIFDED